MPGGSATHRPGLEKLVEKQVRNWELSRSQRPAPHPAAPPRQVEDFVTISRLVQAGGQEVAHELGQRLGWPVFDREILQAMAGDDRVRARLYEYMDERDLGWIEDTMRWLMGEEFRKDDYFHRLSETILALARQGRAVFLGRAADLMLPRDRGLRICLVASPETYAPRLAEQRKISVALAHAEIERIQHDRLEFLRRHFGKAATEPTRHDLTFNMDRVPIAEVVDLVCHVLRSRGVIP